MGQLICNNCQRFRSADSGPDPLAGQEVGWLTWRCLLFLKTEKLSDYWARIVGLGH